MSETVSAHVRRGLVSFAVALCSTWALGGTAAAQSTVVLNQTDSQVTDTTIRAGVYENTNYDPGPLVTRRSSAAEPEWDRRVILKFDTKNTIPQGADVVSATLTLTVKEGLGSGTRPIQAFRIPTPFQEGDATWNTRQGSTRWSTPGGDIGDYINGAYVAPATGSKLTIDVTAIVQHAVNGDYDSRYTRVLLADAGDANKDSYREYYSSEDGTASRRPTLTVVLATTGTSVPPPPPSSGTTLKVLQWNIAQGIGQDGQSNIDRVVNFIASWRPDGISFNEIMHYSSTSASQVVQISEKLRAKTGQTWRYKWVQKGGASSGEGECVMTHLDVD